MYFIILGAFWVSCKLHGYLIIIFNVLSILLRIRVFWVFYYSRGILEILGLYGYFRVFLNFMSFFVAVRLFLVFYYSRGILGILWIINGILLFFNFISILLIIMAHLVFYYSWSILGILQITCVCHYNFLFFEYFIYYKGILGILLL